MKEYGNKYIKYRWRSEAMPLGLSLWFVNLDDVKEKVAQILNSLGQDIVISLGQDIVISLGQDIVISLAGWDCFQSALSL